MCGQSFPAFLAHFLRSCCAVTSMRVDMQEALSALALLTQISDRDNNEIVENLVSDSRPPPPEAEKLLPVVHTTWGFLLQGLALPNPAARTEEAARLLAHVAMLAGGFVARRFTKEALPLLLRLLDGSEGVARPASASHSGSGDSSGCGGYMYMDEGAASGTRDRRQRAALGCIQACCNTAEGSLAIVSEVGGLAAAVLGCLAAAGSAAVAEAALACMRQLAAVDADAVWLLLVRVLHTQGADVPRVSGLDRLDVCHGVAGGLWRGDKAAWLRQCGKVLRDVEAAEVAWHTAARAGRAYAEQAWVVPEAAASSDL